MIFCIKTEIRSNVVMFQSSLDMVKHGKDVKHRLRERGGGGVSKQSHKYPLHSTGKLFKLINKNQMGPKKSEISESVPAVSSAHVMYILDGQWPWVG